MMFPWEQVRDLRKSGHPEKALERGRALLAEVPGDFRVRGQTQWAVYDLVKAATARIHGAIEASKKGSFADFRVLLELLETYKGLEPTTPDKATSNVLHHLSKLGRHFDWLRPIFRHR